MTGQGASGSFTRESPAWVFLPLLLSKGDSLAVAPCP